MTTQTPTSESTALDRTDAAHWAPPDSAPCVVLARTEGAAAAARVFMPERADIVTGETVDGYDAGLRARDLCRRCPVREACLSVKVERNEKLSIMGGAGGARHRALRRAFVAGPEVWAAASAAHFRWLDGAAAEPGDRVLLAASGGAREHGRRSCFAAGCRHDACALAAGLEGARASGGRSVAEAVAAWREAA